MDLLKRYLAALFIVFLHFRASIVSFTSADNRFFHHWSRLDALARILDLLLGAAILLAGASVTRWLLRSRSALSPARRITAHALPLALASGVFAFFPESLGSRQPLVQPLVWMLVLAALGFSAASSRSRVPALAFNACLVGSPVVFIVAVQMLTWGSWTDPPRTSFQPRPPSRPATPVFVFLFDELSRQRSMPCGEIAPFLESFRDFARQAVLFRQAESPHEETQQSVPRFLFQRQDELGWRDGRLHWKAANGEVPTTESPSLFRLAKEQGYNTYVLGWYLPYGRLLGEQVDYCRTFPSTARGETLLAEMGYTAGNALATWSDPLGQSAYRAYLRKAAWPLRAQYQGEMARGWTEILRTCPVNSFVVLHSFLPHGPFVFHPDGTYRKDRTGVHNPEGYESGLRYMDRELGRALAILRERGFHDEALIIVLADHSWRDDLEPSSWAVPQWKRAIPLAIKLPGQQSPETIDERFVTTGLQPLLEAAFGGKRATQELLAVLRDAVRMQADPR